MAQLLPNGRQQFLDANGNPLVGGLVYFYIPNTTTPKDTWQDSAGTILNTNPVVCDARGQALIFGSGDYRQILKDAGGISIWDGVVSSFGAGVSNFASATDPSPGVSAFDTWADSGNMLLKRRNAANTAWITLAPLFTEMAVKTGDAAQTFKVAPSSDPTHAVAQSQVLGIDQAWQDVTADRTLGASYVNSTGKPITVHIEGTANAVNASVVIMVDGVYYMGLQNANSAGFVYQATAIIFPGETYLYTITNYTSYLIREYR